MEKNKIPNVPTKDGNLQAVTFQVELNPIDKEALPVSVVQVLPLGQVKVRDHRSDFLVSDISIISILGYFGSSSVDLAIDYNHGMYYGDNHDAAGWGEKIWAIVPPDVHDRIAPFLEPYGERATVVSSEDEADWGIHVFVRWTEAAAAKITAREYRYISPVVFFNFTGEANYLWNAALVNTPAIDGMDALAASMLPPQREVVEDEDTIIQDQAESSAAGQVQPDDGTGGEPNSPDDDSKGDDMDLKAFAASIRPDVDTEDKDFNEEAFTSEVVEEIVNLRKRDKDNEALATQLESVKADVVESREALKATGIENVELREQVDGFEAAGRESKVAASIEDGTIAESQRDWALKNYPAFETLLETLGDEQKLGPPQGESLKVETEKDTLTPEGDLTVETIKAYAKEKGLDSFEKAYIELRKAGK